MDNTELRDKIRAEAADDAFDDGIFEAVCQCVASVRETLLAHGKPDLSIDQDDRLTDALRETVETALRGME
jgi:hypothetical protein